MPKENKKKKSFERKETLMRILVAIVSGIVLEVWGYFILVILVIHLFYTLFTGKRKKEFAELCEVWNTQFYVYMRYVSFVTNERPFPFRNLTKNFSSFEN